MRRLVERLAGEILGHRWHRALARGQLGRPDLRRFLRDARPPAEVIETWNVRLTVNRPGLDSWLTGS